jgi:hypothetical protein
LTAGNTAVKATPTCTHDLIICQNELYQSMNLMLEASCQWVGNKEKKPQKFTIKLWSTICVLILKKQLIRKLYPKYK